jgi:hypothetical protein
MPKTSNQNTRRTALRDLRILVTTLSLTAIIGLWNVFSHQAQQDLAAAESDNLVNAGPAPTGEDGLPPLPTLVPMDDMLIIRNPESKASVQSEAEAASLREVTAPTPVIIQNRPPLVESVVIGQQPAADSGGSSSSKPKPAANTGSSK